MWFNGKNPIKKLAWNLDNDMIHMNVITIERVKHYGTNLKNYNAVYHSQSVYYFGSKVTAHKM